MVIAFVISFLTFVLLFVSSSSIARNILGESATPEQIVLKEQELGLDQPLFARYFGWLGQAITGDLGTSWFTHQPVATALAVRLPITLSLTIAALILVAIGATLLGVAAAVHRGWVDRAIQVGGVISDAIPGFVLAIILVTVFGIRLGWFPATSTITPGSGIGAWVASMALPVLALSIGGVTAAAQQIRAAIIAQSERDYVRTLRSRGLDEREVLYKHVLRAAAPVGLTLLSLQFIGMLGGTIIVEQIFALPGIGLIAVTSTAQGDLPMVMGIVMFTVIVVVLVSLAVDIANGWLNPKVRVS